MSATPDSTLANPDQRITDLERQLAECRAELTQRTAERDEALQQQTATAEVLGLINLARSHGTGSRGTVGSGWEKISQNAHLLTGEIR